MGILTLRKMVYWIKWELIFFNIWLLCFAFFSISLYWIYIHNNFDKIHFPAVSFTCPRVLLIGICQTQLGQWHSVWLGCLSSSFTLQMAYHKERVLMDSHRHVAQKTHLSGFFCCGVHCACYLVMKPGVWECVIGGQDLWSPGHGQRGWAWNVINKMN